MEDLPWVDTTLGLYRQMRMKPDEQLRRCHSILPLPQRAGYPNAGSEGGHVRLCKGAYKEPAQVAFPKEK